MGVATPERTVRKALGELQRPAERKTKERVFRFLLFAATVVGVVVLGVLIVSVAIDGVPRINSTFFTNYYSRFPERTGIRSGLTGTLSLMVLTASFSFPIGVGAAIYLEEFAPKNRLTDLLEANVSNLAGVPSVVYGLLGAAVFVYLLDFGRSLLAASLALSLLILPVIIVAGRESIRAVPQAIRQGGLALGGTPWQVASRQVLPAAMPGILTGTILALSRAIGETAPILVVGAAFTRRADNVPWEPLDSFTALPIQIFQFVSNFQEEFRVDAASAGIVVLLVVLLLMNSAAILLRNRYSRRW